MKNTSMIVLAILLLLASLASSAEQGQAFSVEPTELRAKDLASALGVKSWSFDLRFDESISIIRVTLVEHRRDRDGNWSREQLAPYSGFNHERSREHEELEVAVLILDDDMDSGFGLRVGDVFSRGDFSVQPDFSRTYTYSSDAVFIRDVLVLAIEEADPGMVTGREEDIKRIIGLEIDIQ